MRSHSVLRDHLQGVAAAGRLRISGDRAARLFHAAACGMGITSLDMNVEDRDPLLSEAVCLMALATIVTERQVLTAPS